MSTIAEFLHTIFTNSGIEVTDEQLAGIVKATATVPLPAELTDKFNQSYVTRDQAIKGDPALKQEFAKILQSDGTLRKAMFAEFRNGDEAMLSTLATEYGVEIDPSATDYKTKLKSTFAKLAEAKASGDKVDVKKYTDQINDLNKKLSGVEADYQAKIQQAIAEKESEFNNELLTSYYENQLSNHTLIDSPNGDTALMKRIALDTIKNKLQLMDAEIVRTSDKRFQVKRKSSPDLDYFENGKTVMPENLITKVLVDNKLVKQQQAQPVKTDKPQYTPEYGAENDFQRIRREQAERDNKQRPQES
jgi:hypothetical protein